MNQYHFILSVFDLQLWCPVLETRFSVDDLPALRTIIGADVDADPNFDWRYHIDADDLKAINQGFAVEFDPQRLEFPESEIWLQQDRIQGSRADIPYLVHTGFELPLMLDGRKKLTRFTNVDSPGTEEAFDRWVKKGLLHKEVFLKPIPESLKPYAIDISHYVAREVYYALKGEEWRIRAMELLWEAAGAGVGWNEHYERIEGMLFGYEDWQNDWWIENANKTRGGIRGIPLYCAVDADGLEWMKLAGYKALPPIGRDEFHVRYHDWDDEENMTRFLMEEETSVALVRFKVSHELQRELFPVGRKRPEPFLIKRNQIPEINRHLIRQVDIVLQR